MLNFDGLHSVACKEGRDTYIDPNTGYQVLTALALKKQGKCCGNSCRHCPYGHINVRSPKKSDQKIASPVLMNWVPQDGEVDVLFWSGGKDSFLTLMHLLEEKRSVVLLTSFGALTNRVSIQNIHIKNIAMQADFFKVPLCLVPLFPNSDYKTSIEQALQMIRDQTGAGINRLVFGDLHLRDIRQWRLDTWSHYEVYTPLFDLPIELLLSKLWRLQAEHHLSITLSTEIKTPDGILPVDSPYSAELVNHLILSGLDPMLENGEGHTFVFPRAYKQYQCQ